MRIEYKLFETIILYIKWNMKIMKLYMNSKWESPKPLWGLELDSVKYKEYYAIDNNISLKCETKEWNSTWIHFTQ